MNGNLLINAAELFRMLRQQRDAYRRLRVLADRQRSLVLLDDAAALLGVLADRQRVVDALAGLNQTLAPYRQQWTQVYRGMDPAQQREAKELLQESNALLAAVMSSDAQDAETLGARRQTTAAALAETRVAGRAVAAYATSQSDGAAGGLLAESHA